MILIGVAIALTALAAFGPNWGRTVVQAAIVGLTILIVGFLLFLQTVGSATGVPHQRWSEIEQDCGWVLLGGAVLVVLLQLTKLTRRKSAPRA